MDVKQYTMMAVGLVVGVLLIAGVVAPVIANVSSNGGGGGGEDTVTRTNVMGNMGDLPFSYANKDTAITYYLLDDGWGTSLSSETVYMDEDVDIYTDNECLNAYVYSANNEYGFEVWVASTDEVFLISELSIEGTTASFTPLPTQENPNPQKMSFEGVTFYTDPNGDYLNVFSKDGYNPYLSKDSKFCIQLDIDLDGDSGVLVIQGTSGDNSIWVLQGSEYIQSISESAVITTDGGKIDSISLSVNGIEYSYSADYGSENPGRFDKIILPQTVTFSEEEAESIPPANGFWKMAGNDEFDILSAYLGSNQYGVAIGNPDDGGKEIYKGSISAGSFVLPIMIGETFFVTIEWNADNPMDDWRAEMMVYGVGDPESGGPYPLSYTNAIHVEGKTITFEDMSTGSAVERSADGLIAHIFDEGEYTAFTEPTNAELSYIGVSGSYTYSSYDYVAGDMADVNIVMIGIMSGTDLSYVSGTFRGSISVDGEDNWDDTEYALTTSNTSCQINKSNGMFTGLTVSTQDKSVSFPVGLFYDSTNTDDLFEESGGSVFGIGKIGSGGGSGGGASTTLTTILSVIPLVLTVGLVLGAVAFLRMKN